MSDPFLPDHPQFVSTDSNGGAIRAAEGFASAVHSGRVRKPIVVAGLVLIGLAVLVLAVAVIASR